jgi:ferritin-like metal-binding protein YciE
MLVIQNYMNNILMDSKKSKEVSSISKDKEIKSGSKTISCLRDLFEGELKSIHAAEKALVNVIPKIVTHTSSEELSEALIEHLEVIKDQIKRLEDAFTSLNIKPDHAKCLEMEALIKGVEKIIAETEQGVIQDEGVILMLQKITNYKIAAYGTLSAFAGTMGESEVNYLLAETLNEEIAVNEHFTDIAFFINLEITDNEVLINE